MSAEVDAGVKKSSTKKSQPKVIRLPLTISNAQPNFAQAKQVELEQILTKDGQGESWLSELDENFDLLADPASWDEVDDYSDTLHTNLEYREQRKEKVTAPKIQSIINQLKDLR